MPPSGTWNCDVPQELVWTSVLCSRRTVRPDRASVSRTRQQPAGQSSHSFKFDDMTAERVCDRSTADCVCARLSPQTAAPSPAPAPAQQQHPQRTPRQASAHWRVFRRRVRHLGELLTVAVWLLSAVRLPPTMSAPLGRLEARFNTKPKWIDPCGSNTELAYDSETRSEDVPRPIDNTILMASVATEYADGFRDSYVRLTFNLNFDVWHQTWKSKHYDWLPSSDAIPKSLGEPTPAEHLERLEPDSWLKNMYRNLQMYAVGLEQITWDQEDSGGLFRDNFNELEYHFKTMLCEMQTFLLERNVQQYPDVGREIMDESIRLTNNKSHRNLRDWLIFRDSMNAVEYVSQVLEYFNKKYPTI